MNTNLNDELKISNYLQILNNPVLCGALSDEDRMTLTKEVLKYAKLSAKIIQGNEMNDLRPFGEGSDKKMRF